MSWYVPRGTPIVAGDRRVHQKVQLHVVVELLRRARVQRLRQVLHLRHEVVHVVLHRREIQREALRGLPPVRGRRGCAPLLLLLRVAATPEPPCVKCAGLHQNQQQHRRNHPERHHLRTLDLPLKDGDAKNANNNCVRVWRRRDFFFLVLNDFTQTQKSHVVAQNHPIKVSKVCLKLSTLCFPLVETGRSASGPSTRA